jgi:hypothetical protein
VVFLKFLKLDPRKTFFSKPYYCLKLAFKIIWFHWFWKTWAGPLGDETTI